MFLILSYLHKVVYEVIRYLALIIMYFKGTFAFLPFFLEMLLGLVKKLNSISAYISADSCFSLEGTGTFRVIILSRVQSANRNVSVFLIHHDEIYNCFVIMCILIVNIYEKLRLI